jgi:tetratricopeptide (TPR) repeat protein
MEIPPSSEQIEAEVGKDEERKIEEDKTEERQEKEQQKKNVRTKAELLALVKKRLAEIEKSHQEEQETEPDALEMDPKDEQARLIDRFINAAPSISRPNKNDFFDPQQEAVNSSFDEEDFLVTETLAKIHTDQGNLEKAAEIYKKLILKFPEKSSYFAALIQDLKK